MPNEYQAIWKIDLHAEPPEDAARKGKFASLTDREIDALSERLTFST